jgi:hypothetical protein
MLQQWLLALSQWSGGAVPVRILTELALTALFFVALMLK